MVDLSYYYERLTELGVEDPRADAEHYPFVLAQRNPEAIHHNIGAIYFNIKDIERTFVDYPPPRAWGKNARLDDHFDLMVFRCTDRAEILKFFSDWDDKEKGEVTEELDRFEKRGKRTKRLHNRRKIERRMTRQITNSLPHSDTCIL